jgi:hypothetical protein
MTEMKHKRFAQKTIHDEAIAHFVMDTNALFGNHTDSILLGEIREQAEKLAVGKRIKFTGTTELERVL